MKYCPKCKTWKDESEYHPDKRRPSGLAGWCKKCKNECVALYAAKHPDKGKERAKRWRANNPERSNMQSAAWVKKNPEKRKQIELNNYLKHKDERAPAARARSKAWYNSNRETVFPNLCSGLF